MTVTVPEWFSAALEQRPEHRRLDVAGVSIAYRAWGEPGAPVLVLVHGGAANGSWWDHVAPQFAEGWRVLALDLSGHGDSERRPSYSFGQWAAEVLAVAAAEQPSGGAAKPFVVGHSMGGFVTLRAAVDHADEIAGAVVIDSPVRPTKPDSRARDAAAVSAYRHSIYPELEQMVPRFRTIPVDPASLDFVLEHVARESAEEVDGGWQWKFDPAIFVGGRMEPTELAPTTCPLHYVHGTHGLATPEMIAGLKLAVGQDFPVTLIRDAGHHIMLDHPIALGATLQTIAAEYRSSS